MSFVEINPSVAKVSPNFARALQKSALPPEQIKIVEQMSRTWTLGKDLLKKPKDQGRKEFLELDPIVQQNLNFLYSNQEMFKPEKSFGAKILSGAVDVVTAPLKALASPLVMGFKAIDAWDKTFKTPISVAQQKVGGKQDFSKKLITDSFNGKNMWRADSVAEYEAKYGKALVTLARGLAEQRTPGEAIDLYGKFDNDMMTAIRFMGDEPKLFDNLVLEIKQNAQMSPGRNVSAPLGAKARMSTPAEIAAAKKSPWYKIAKAFGFDVATTEGQQKAQAAISGPVDAMYSILNPLDPLTYVGVGPAIKSTKALAEITKVSATDALRFAGFKSRGEQLVDQYKFIADKFGATGIKKATQFVFKEPDVVKHWDTEIGPAIQKYAEAPTAAYKADAYREIRQTYPEWANESVVNLFAKSKVFNAKRAENFFQKAENGRYLLSMSVEGIQQTRNGIPVARNYRNTTTELHKKFYSFFNPTAKSAEDFAKIDETAEKTIQILSKTGKGTSLISSELDEVAKIAKERQTFLTNVGRYASRAPRSILYGEDSIKTIEEVRNLATLVTNKDVAEAIAQLYVKLSPEYQITVVRNLHDAYYRGIGMYGHPSGADHAAELLNKTFNEKAGLTNTVRAEVPQGWENVMERALYKYENDVPVIRTRGAIHPAQLTEGIAPIDFDLALEYAAQARLAGRFNFFNLAGGALRNKASRIFNNFWVTGTLFPRLGIRTSVDEGFMYALAAPYYDLLDLAMGPAGKGVAQRDVSTMVSGSKAGVGMYKRGLYKIFPTLDKTKKISAAERIKILEDLAESKGRNISVAELSQAEKNLAITDRAIELYGKTMPEEVWQAVRLVMKHNPKMLDSMANSLGARSTLSGTVDVDYMDVMFNQSAWTQAIEEFGLKQGSKYKSKLISQMTDKEVAIAHFDNFETRFSANTQKVKPGLYISPTNYFFNHNGLRTIDDFIAARNSMLEKLGVIYDKQSDTFIANQSNAIKEFIAPYSTTAWLREDGLTNIQIAKHHIEAMLMDMKNTFHGTTNAFNESFFNFVKNRQREIVLAAKDAGRKAPSDSWAKAIQSITFKEFEDLTGGFRPVGEINTRLVRVGKTDVDMKSFEEMSGFEGILNNFQNWAMDAMDATVTGLLRQKIIWFKTTKNLRELKAFELNIKDDIITAAKESNPFMTKKQEEYIRKHAAEVAEARIVNLAYETAINDAITLVDNPSVRSNLAVSVRSVGRFYRATEDFMRRVYRLYTKKPLRSLTRMRLLQTGLQASGDVYIDDKGDEYVIFPTDSIITNALFPVLESLFGKDTIKIPVFNDLTLKLKLVNPSFAPDAGQPALSGPISAVMMIGVKALLRELPFVPSSIKEEFKPVTNKAIEIIDTMALGNIGANLDLYRALTPMFVQSIWGTLTPSEWDRQKSSAVLSAIASFQAFGYGLSSNATAEEKREYLKNIKIATNSIIAFRNFSGNILAGQPSLKETISLTDAVKRAGITSPKAEFWDVYNSILRNSDGDLGNTFDLAVMTWIGKNPGKSAFIVPRNNKSYKVFINKTNEVKNWAVENSEFIETYKEIAWVFSPRSGEYNPDIYNWMQAEGLIDRPDFEQYLEAVQLQEDKIAYFDIDKRKEATLKSTNDITLRKQAIDKAEYEKRMMRASNPYLAADVESGLESQGELEKKFKLLNEAVESPKSPIDKTTRTALRLVIQQINGLREYALDADNRQRFDYSIAKGEMKDRIEASLKELADANTTVNEAARLVFTPLLNTYSKETISAGARG